MFGDAIGCGGACVDLDVVDVDIDVVGVVCGCDI